MNEDSHLPDALNELFSAERKSQPVIATKNDILYGAITKSLADYPDSAFRWNWSKWRYEFEFEGKISFVTWSEYRGSRRVRAMRG